MAKINRDGIGTLATIDSQLAWAVGTAFPAAQAVKERTGESAKWEDLPAPPTAIVPVKRNQETGEVETETNAKGEPLSPAQIVFNRLVARYNPKNVKNKRGNQKLYSIVRTMKMRFNSASGITRGRGGAEIVPAEVADDIADQLDLSSF